jgi:CheY-like chemotaxis protein
MFADDHRILVEAIHSLLKPDCNVVAAVADGRSLLEIATQVNPELMVIDTGMPVINGLEASI